MPMRDVLGFEGRYAVTRGGRVWSYQRPGRWHAGFMKLISDKNGYLCAHLWDGQRLRCKRVSRLVLEAFIGPAPTQEHEANHKDGTKTNNRLGNLEWTTGLENTHHSILTGLVKGRQPRFVEIDGCSRPLAELCKEYQINYFVAHARIFRKGWDAKKALTTPVIKKAVA